MRIKLDENMPASLASDLGELGHDTDTVPNEGLAGCEDADVWTATQAASRFFVTQDLDFSDVREFRPGTHGGLMLVRLRAPGRTALRARVLSIFTREAAADWEGCFVVVTDTKVRVRRP